MPALIADPKLISKLEKKQKQHKIKDALQRWEKTKSDFEKDYRNPALDFKKHKGSRDSFKIRLLMLKGKDDGYRLFLWKRKDSYYAYEFSDHDSLDK